MDTDVDSLAEAGEPTGYELVVTNTGSVRMSTVTVGGPAVVQHRKYVTIYSSIGASTNVRNLTSVEQP